MPGGPHDGPPSLQVRWRRWRRAPCGSRRGPRACVALRIVLELLGMLLDAPLGYTKLPAMARRVAAAECDVPWSTRCCPGARRVARIARRSSCVPFVLLGAWLAALLCKPCWPRRCCLRDAESGLAACFRLARACPPPCRCLGPRCAAGMLGRAWCSGPLGSTRRAAMHVALAAAAAFAAFVRACCAVWLGCVLPACPCLRSGARLPGVVRRACVCSWSESVLAVHWAAARRLAMRTLGRPSVAPFL